MKPAAPEQIRRVLEGLQSAHTETVIVGGQAINLWAVHYRRPTRSWANLLPYASEDLDCLGGKLELLSLRQEPGGRVRLNKIPLKNTPSLSPETSTVTGQFEPQNQPLRPKSSLVFFTTDSPTICCRR